MGEVATLPNKPVDSLTARLHRPPTSVPNISCVIYGRGGAGKTTLVATMPTKMKGLLLDVPMIEGGSSVLAQASDRIEVFDVQEWNDLADIYKKITTAKRDASLPREQRDRWDFDYLAIDTITALQRLAIRKTVRGRGDIDPNTVSQQDWGKIGNLMAELVFQWGTLPIHKIWLAQERVKDNYEGRRSYMPDVSPMALASLIPPQYLVGRIYVAEAEGNPGEEVRWERHLRVGSHPNYETKVRSTPGHELPNIIRSPNLTQIFGWIMGSAKATRPEAVVETGLETL